jgi:carbamoyltransferase
VEHHECHASYGYLTSPFKKEKCLIFTIDGAGDRGINATISIGENGNQKKIYETSNCLIGRIYSHVTLLLGMRRLEHEYKLMGLAPYAEKKIPDKLYEVFNKILYLDKFKFRFLKKNQETLIFIFKKNWRAIDLIILVQQCKNGLRIYYAIGSKIQLGPSK